MSEREEKRMETIQKQMEETMATMRKDLDTIMREVRARGEMAVDKSRETVRERPLTSVGVAFGAGLLVGIILIKAMERKRD